MTIAYLQGRTDLAANPTPIWMRRALDLIIAGTGLVLFGPIMMLVALAIWIESGRPIFFSHVRFGQTGRHFRMYKFRKFHKDCGTANCPVTVRNDRRMTPVGRFLAGTKLDELPQLWNIVKGDMSVVGPRPESLDFADCLVGSYRGVLDHKPGIFGPNQVFFRDEASLYSDVSDPKQFYREILFPLKARIDLAYFPHRTIRSDIRWIIFGVLAVFGLRRGPARKFTAILVGMRNGQNCRRS
jgi:lipopolysaccharide/colanic/teichoic acid biosynthesis glycosyltransferase